MSCSYIVYEALWWIKQTLVLEDFMLRQTKQIIMNLKTNKTKYNPLSDKGLPALAVGDDIATRPIKYAVRPKWSESDLLGIALYLHIISNLQKSVSNSVRTFFILCSLPRCTQLFFLTIWEVGHLFPNNIFFNIFTK